MKQSSAQQVIVLNHYQEIPDKTIQLSRVIDNEVIEKPAWNEKAWSGRNSSTTLPLASEDRYFSGRAKRIGRHTQSLIYVKNWLRSLNRFSRGLLQARAIRSTRQK